MSEHIDPNCCPKCACTDLETLEASAGDLGEYLVDKSCLECGTVFCVVYKPIAVDIIEEGRPVIDEDMDKY